MLLCFRAGTPTFLPTWQSVGDKGEWRVRIEGFGAHLRRFAF